MKGGEIMTNKVEKIKKTFYVNSDIVKFIKIKSALDESTETDTINFILGDYFNEHQNKYSFLRKEK